MSDSDPLANCEFEINSFEIFPPSTGESMAFFLPDNGAILISGVFVGGPSNRTISLDEVVADDDEVSVRIREVDDADSDQFVMGADRPISYSVRLEFTPAIPNEVVITHTSDGERTLERRILNR
ncbi:hypothetical protein [Halosimplex salinum]|uniref:hypothetical protein n=1 Tax=Halosimplex salinum TaxID=1710538 RepID=UPI0019D23D77|nr:hypothetical protein [Halosimplex salinum]